MITKASRFPVVTLVEKGGGSVVAFVARPLATFAVHLSAVDVRVGYRISAR